MTLLNSYLELLARGNRPQPAISHPTMFGADLFLWLRADLGFSVDGSQNLLTWTDQGPRGSVFTSQASGKPVKTASVLNGKPGMLHGTNSTLWTSGAATLAPPYTAIAVMKSAAAVGTNIFGPYDGTTVAHGLAHGGVGQFRTIQSVGWISDILAIADATEANGCVFRTSTNATASMNSVTVSAGTGSFGTFTFTNGLSDILRPVASSTYTCEIILVKRVITPSDLAPYMLAQWNLAFT